VALDCFEHGMAQCELAARVRAHAVAGPLHGGGAERPARARAVHRLRGHEDFALAVEEARAPPRAADVGVAEAPQLRLRRKGDLGLTAPDQLQRVDRLGAEQLGGLAQRAGLRLLPALALAVADLK